MELHWKLFLTNYNHYWWQAPSVSPVIAADFRSSPEVEELASEQPTPCKSICMDPFRRRRHWWRHRRRRWCICRSYRPRRAADSTEAFVSRSSGGCSGSLGSSGSTRSLSGPGKSGCVFVTPCRTEPPSQGITDNVGKWVKCPMPHLPKMNLSWRNRKLGCFIGNCKLNRFDSNSLGRFSI